MPGAPAELVLPEDCETALRLALPVLCEFVPESSLRLGGGTTLAARWRHRDSFDVDLFLDPDVYSERVWERVREFKRILQAATGGRVAIADRQGFQVGFAGAKLDVSGSAPFTQHAVSGDFLKDSDLAVESTAEILAKKLHLRLLSHGRFIARDFYDFAVARRLEPEAMAVAWAACEPVNLESISVGLRSCSPGWMERQADPVVGARFPQLVGVALGDMLDDIDRHLAASGRDRVAD